MPAKGDGISKRKDGRYVGRYTVHTADGPKRKVIYGRKYKEFERKLAVRRGGKARGAGELAEIKSEIRSVIRSVQSEKLDRGVGAVVFQGYNTLLRAVEVERKVRELDELEERIAAMEGRVHRYAG
jgi:hypothetical protein